MTRQRCPAANGPPQAAGEPMPPDMDPLSPTGRRLLEALQASVVKQVR